jgi:hypothetical protein
VVQESELMRGRTRFANVDFGSKALDFLEQVAAKSANYAKEVAQLVKRVCGDQKINIERPCSRKFESESKDITVDSQLDAHTDVLVELRFSHRKDARQEWLFHALANAVLQEPRPRGVVVVDVLGGQVFQAKFRDSAADTWRGIEETIMNVRIRYFFCRSK